MQTWQILLLAYYVPSLIVSIVLLEVMRPIYVYEGTKPSYWAMLRAVAIPFIGFWIYVFLMVLQDYKIHLSNEESRNRKLKRGDKA